MNAIEKVTDSKVKGSASTVVNRLYIADSDYNDFMNYYNRYKNGNTIYLFRYMTSEYVAEQASLVKIKGGKIDDNAYFFKETINLNFDIIDLTFTRDGASTVIPAVMTPIDIIYESTPPVQPVEETADNFLKKLLMLIALIIALIILVPLLPYILKLLWWLIKLPFKLAIWIAKTIQGSVNKPGGK